MMLGPATSGPGSGARTATRGARAPAAPCCAGSGPSATAGQPSRTRLYKRAKVGLCFSVGQRIGNGFAQVSEPFALILAHGLGDILCLSVRLAVGLI